MPYIFWVLKVKMQCQTHMCLSSNFAQYSIHSNIHMSSTPCLDFFWEQPMHKLFKRLTLHRTFVWYILQRLQVVYICLILYSPNSNHFTTFLIFSGKNIVFVTVLLFSALIKIEDWYLVYFSCQNTLFDSKHKDSKEQQFLALCWSHVTE